MNKAEAIKKMETLTELGRYSRRIISKAGDLSRRDLAEFIPEEARS